MQDKKTLEELIKELPPHYQTEVKDFVVFLLTKHEAKKGRRLSQNWAGALSEHRDKYTSVALQHEASQR